MSKRKANASNNFNFLMPREPENIEKIFTTENPIMPIPLSEAFAKVRYKYNPESNTVDFSGVRHADTFHSNTGAVQLFNINNSEPLTDPVGSVSERLGKPEHEGIHPSWGHSERQGMRYVLDKFIPENNGEIKRPSDYGNSPNPNDRKLEIFQSLVRNAPQYKDYLKNKNAIVKMWSERSACGTPNMAKSCQEFLQDIFPEKSQYRFIAKNNSVKSVEEASGELKNAYNRWVSSQQNPPTVLQQSPLVNTTTLFPDRSSSSINLSSRDFSNSPSKRIHTGQGQSGGLGGGFYLNNSDLPPVASNHVFLSTQQPPLQLFLGQNPILGAIGNPVGFHDQIPPSRSPSRSPSPRSSLGSEKDGFTSWSQFDEEDRPFGWLQGIPDQFRARGGHIKNNFDMRKQLRLLESRLC